MQFYHFIRLNLILELNNFMFFYIKTVRLNKNNRFRFIICRFYKVFVNCFNYNPSEYSIAY